MQIWVYGFIKVWISTTIFSQCICTALHWVTCPFRQHKYFSSSKLPSKAFLRDQNEIGGPRKQCLWEHKAGASLWRPALASSGSTIKHWETNSSSPCRNCSDPSSPGHSIEATPTCSEPGIAIATHANKPPLFVLHWCSVVTQPCINTLDRHRDPKYLTVTQCCVYSHNTCASISSSL